MLEILTPYLINLIAVTLLVRGLYYRTYKRSDLFLTFFGFNTIIFFVAIVLNQVDLSTGAAFGLFAVFSILRYRTEGLSAKDMTYLFLSIALGLLGATTQNINLKLLLNAVILTLVFFFRERLDIPQRKEHGRAVRQHRFGAQGPIRGVGGGFAVAHRLERGSL